jgi:hypothetical protein
LETPNRGKHLRFTALSRCFLDQEP